MLRLTPLRQCLGRSGCCRRLKLVEDGVAQLVQAAAAREPDFRGRILHEKVQAEVEQLHHLAAQEGVDHVDLRANDGDFEGVLTTDLRKIDVNNNTTLGRLCFSLVKPIDLEIQLNDEKGKAITGLPDQVKGMFEGNPKSYVVHSHFKFRPQTDSSSSSTSTSSSSTSSPTDDFIHGVFSVIGRYELGKEGPQRLNVFFDKVRLRPADPRQLPAWLEALGPLNPSISKEDGTLEVHLPTPPKGTLDYLVMTDKWHVSKGNLGSIVVMKRSGTDA